MRPDHAITSFLHFHSFLPGSCVPWLVFSAELLSFSRSGKIPTPISPSLFPGTHFHRQDSSRPFPPLTKNPTPTLAEHRILAASEHSNGGSPTRRSIDAVSQIPRGNRRDAQSSLESWSSAFPFHCTSSDVLWCLSSRTLPRRRMISLSLLSRSLFSL
jgi:hypothetical protein